MIERALDELRRGTRALAVLVDEAGAVWPKVSAALHATCDDVERRMDEPDLVVLLVGTTEAKRALVNEVLGEALLPPSSTPSKAVPITIRRGDVRRYVVTTSSGERVLEPERARILAAGVARAEEGLATARAVLAQLERTRDRLASSPAPVVIRESDPELDEVVVAAPRGARAWLASVWVAILSLFGLGAPRRMELAPTPASPVSPRVDESAQAEPDPKRLEALVAIDREIVDAEAAALAARHRAIEALQEQAAYLAEHQARYGAEVRALFAANADVASIVLEHPTPRLPRGVVLLDEEVPDDGSAEKTWRRLRRMVRACILVKGTDRKTSTLVDPQGMLGPIVPHEVEVPATGLARSLEPVFEAVERESRTMLAALAITETLGVLRALAEAGSQAEAEQRAHIGVLEKDRTIDPAVLREEQLEGLRPTTTAASARILRAVTDQWRVAIAGLRAEWRAAIDACSDRASTEAVVSKLNSSAPLRLAGAVDEIGDALGTEMQKNTERLQGWLLDELSIRYKTLSAAAITMPVVVTDVTEEVPSVRSMPFASVVDKFEKRRVTIGLGGAAAGAALGTLVFPGIGTAVGAFVGVFAGFLEGLANLKRDAIERLDKHLAVVETDVAEQLERGKHDLAADMQASLADTLDAELARRSTAIARQRDVEARAIEREEQKLARIGALQASLSEHRRRFAKLEKDIVDLLERHLEERNPGAPSTARVDAVSAEASNG